MACRVMDTVFYYLGWALSVVSMTVDPEVFVIGGGVSRAGSFLTEGIRKYFDQFTTLSDQKAEITLAQLATTPEFTGRPD